MARQRPEMVTFRTTSAELKAINDLARSLNVPRSELVRSGVELVRRLGVLPAAKPPAEAPASTDR